MKTFKIASQITSCRPLLDKSMSITFHTQELPKDEKVLLMDYLGEAGWLLFRPDEISQEEVPDQDSEFEKKTSSQRLRNTIYVYWKQQNTKEDFENFYKRNMENIINQYKNKLL